MKKLLMVSIMTVMVICLAVSLSSARGGGGHGGYGGGHAGYSGGHGGHSGYHGGYSGGHRFYRGGYYGPRGYYGAYYRGGYGYAAARVPGYWSEVCDDWGCAPVWIPGYHR